MTDKRFYYDTYCFELEAFCIAQGQDEFGFYLVLEQTIFYPQSGGQPQDLGEFLLGEKKYPIIKGKQENEIIKHYILSSEFNWVGQKIKIKIDPLLRQKHARYHTAGHYLTQIILERLNLQWISQKGHHFPDQAYILFHLQEDKNEDLLKIQSDIEQIIRQEKKLNLSIDAKQIDTADIVWDEVYHAHSPWLLEMKNLRLTQIEGYLWLPCGGTHVKNISEIGDFSKIEIKKKKQEIKVKYELSS